MKLSKSIAKRVRTNWYYINREVLFILTVLFFLIFFCANLLLNLIDFLTSKF
jgi:hypothetical protein